MIENAIRNMSLSGMVKRYEGDVIRYGITPKCTIPRGLTVAEVMEIMESAEE
jgi:hypothetical protein